jgi:hypothetical protein
MVELRWRNIYSKIVFNGKKTLIKTVLEYRQKIDKTIYAGIQSNSNPVLEWSEWKEVPVIEEEENGKTN